MSTSVSARPGTTEQAQPVKRPTTPVPTRLKVRAALRYVMLGLIALAFISPVLFMLVTSFKTRADATSLPPSWIPSPFSLDAYRTLLAGTGETPVLRGVGNSMLAGAPHALLGGATSGMAASAPAPMGFKGQGIVVWVIIAT